MSCAPVQKSASRLSGSPRSTPDDAPDEYAQGGPLVAWWGMTEAVPQGEGEYVPSDLATAAISTSSASLSAAGLSGDDYSDGPTKLNHGSVDAAEQMDE